MSERLIQDRALHAIPSPVVPIEMGKQVHQSPEDKRRAQRIRRKIKLALTPKEVFPEATEVAPGLNIVPKTTRGLFPLPTEDTIASWFRAAEVFNKAMAQNGKEQAVE